MLNLYSEEEMKEKICPHFSIGRNEDQFCLGRDCAALQYYAYWEKEGTDEVERMRVCCGLNNDHTIVPYEL